MAERTARKAFPYEGAATRYRALMIKTRDPVRRRMLWRSGCLSWVSCPG